MSSISLFQLGYGQVGQAFEKAIQKHNQEAGDPLFHWVAIARSKDKLPLPALSSGQTCSFLLDLTASHNTTAQLLEARQKNWGLILANKNPLAECQEIFEQLLNGPIGFSATVGAGLPVIPEIRKLKADGKQITRLEACLSGSMGILCSELEQGKPFSQIIQEAVDKGFTEPDPRIDLAGADVAKKLLILSRFSGHKLEMDDIYRQALYPAPMQELELPDFMQQLSILDPILEKRMKTAQQNDQTLRFVASFDRNQYQVALKQIPKQSPLGQLTGDQKRILLYTDPQKEPVIITGAGSGAADTAQDLIKDLLTLAQT